MPRFPAAAFFIAALFFSPALRSASTAGGGALGAGAPEAMAGGIPSELGLPNVQNFIAREMPATPTFFAGVADDDGRLYFCNRGWIVSYNSVEWKRFRPTDDMLELRSMAFGPDHKLYIGSINTLGRLTLTDGKFESLLERLPENERVLELITQVISHGDAVYFVSAKRVLVWRGEQFAFIRCPGARLHVVAGVLYLTAPDFPLRRLEGEKLTTVADDPVFRKRDIRLLCDAGDGSLIVCPIQGGLYRLPADRSRSLEPFPTTADAILRQKQIYTGRQLADGSIALGFTIASGGTAIFLRRDGRCLLQLDETSGLQDQNVQGFLEDRDGGLWLSLNQGLARVQWPAAYTYFQRANGLDLSPLRSLVRHRGTLYAVNTRGLYRLVPGESGTKPARFERVLNGQPRKIIVWRDELVVPMWEDVRCITPDGEIRVIYTPPGAVRVSEAATSRQDPNRLWLATTTGLRSLYFDAGVWRDEGPLAETKGTLSYLIEDTDGSLWGSGPGLGFVHVRFAGPTHGPAHPAVRDVHSFVEGSGLPTQVVVGSPRLWDDEMLFTISGANALLRFDREREQFAPVVGVRTIEQPMMLTVGAGRPDHLWMAVDRLEPQQWRIYRSSRDGELRALPQTVNQPLGAAYVFLEEPGPDGDVLWVGGNESIMRVELSRAFVRPSPLVVQLRATEFSPNAQRRPAQRDAEFEYFAPRYQKGAAVSYQTRLAGYEANWSAWSGTRRRGFTNLPPGRYEFMVRAHDTDGVESAPTSISFTILPPWWKTWWFVGLASLSGIGGVAGVTRWFANRALKRRVALLEAQSAVERERLRLARDLHDEVGSGLGRVILFAGEARRNKADPARLETSLDRVRDAAQALVSHAREIVWAVSPQHDALASVIERLGDYTDETLRAAGIACAVQSPSPDKIPPVTLGSEARHSLFLAVKEAVHNCVKYSEAKSAELTLAITGADFVITLRDHGRGFAPGERRGSGHGTKNIIARAEALGGDGEITSEPGKGTVVRLRVPLQQT